VIYGHVIYAATQNDLHFSQFCSHKVKQTG
jgi:hypothetical protein